MRQLVKKASSGFFLLLLSGCSLVGIQNEEQPSYSTVIQDKNKEIRYYQPYIIAKTTVEGEYKDAQQKAFRRLANYIFGDNQSRVSIAMTAPVSQQATSVNNEVISMTTPVTQTAVGGGNTWEMAFMMPSEYTLETLPKPLDNNIQFEKVDARYLAVIRYTGIASEANNATKVAVLNSWLETKAYKPTSEPFFAGYNPPWTLPFFRRNEMMIEVETDSAFDSQKSALAVNEVVN